jgi:two-component system LytT family response regulator
MMAPIRTLIADDEILARRMLSSLVAQDAELTLVGEATDGVELAQLLERQRPELALIDVRMPGADGFSAISQLERLPAVIFITAHPEHAVRAFEVEAVDYVLKPFDDARFARALQRGKLAVRKQRLLELARELGSAPHEAPTERLICRDGRDLLMLDQAQIDWIEACDYYAQIHARGQTHLVREPLHELELRLDPRFMRIHRSSIINLASLQKLEGGEDGNSFAVLQDGTRLRVSRARRAQLAARLPGR